MGDEAGKAGNRKGWKPPQFWSFDSHATNPFFCAMRKTPPIDEYAVAIRVLKGRHKIAIDVSDGDVVKHSWMGHRNSVFLVWKDRLYYADFRSDTCGASIVAVDLDTGQLLWRQPCRAAPHGAHSAYENLINLGVGKDVLVVRGKETFGRYIEGKSLVDGKTIGYEQFKAE